MRISTNCAREMLDRIEQTHGSDWIEAVLSVLPLKCGSEFSEYETYGHYVKNHYPERFAGRHLPWLRHGSRIVGGMPSAADLQRLGQDYAFAAFESSQMFLRRWVRWLRSRLRG